MDATFRYDALNRRTEKTINGETTQYLYDGLDIIQEIEDGMVTVNYIRSLNIDEPLARLDVLGGVRFYHTDALGSVIALTDELGEVRTQYNYTPFGTVEVIGEESDNPFQYTGRENDGTGLYYYRARYYSPEMKRFISEDPIGFAEGVNFYAYVGSDPISGVDPFGLFMASVKYSNEPYGSITMVWTSWLPKFYRSSTRGDNGSEIGMGVYKYKYGKHPLNPNTNKVPYPALNIYTLEGTRDLQGTRTDGGGNVISGVNFHWGNRIGNPKGSGSTGCHVVQKSDWNDFIGNFEKGDQGYYVYFRLW